MLLYYLCKSKIIFVISTRTSTQLLPFQIKKRSNLFKAIEVSLKSIVTKFQLRYFNLYYVSQYYICKSIDINLAIIGLGYWSSQHYNSNDPICDNVQTPLYSGTLFTTFYYREAVILRVLYGRYCTEHEAKLN